MNKSVRNIIFCIRFRTFEEKKNIEEKILLSFFFDQFFFSQNHLKCLYNKKLNKFETAKKCINIFLFWKIFFKSQKLEIKNFLYENFIEKEEFSFAYVSEYCTFLETINLILATSEERKSEEMESSYRVKSTEKSIQLRKMNLVEI